MLFILPVLGGLISYVPFKLLITLKFPFQVKDFFSTAVDMRRTAAAAARWQTTENLNTLVFDGWPQKFPTRCCLSSLFLTKPPICGGVARFFYKFPTTHLMPWRERERDDMYLSRFEPTVELHWDPGPFEGPSTNWATVQGLICPLTQKWRSVFSSMHYCKKN